MAIIGRQYRIFFQRQGKNLLIPDLEKSSRISFDAKIHLKSTNALWCLKETL